MNIATLTQATVAISFEFENRKKEKSAINLQVYEESLTPRAFGKIKQFENEQDGMALSEALSEMIHAWDLDFNGEPFEPTADNISRCPFPFLTAVIEAISETWSGKEPPPKTSVNGSAPAAK